MSIWDVLKSRPAVPTEQSEIDRLTERALANTSANTEALAKAKAAAEEQRKREERLASAIAAKYAGRTE